MTEVSNQSELDAAIKNKQPRIYLKAGGYYEVSSPDDFTMIVSGNDELTIVARESSQPRVEARESSQPRVVARESSQPRVVARESSQPRVEARESSQPRVEARESSQPRVEAWESSQPRVVARESSQPRVVAWESSQPRVEAWGHVQLSIFGKVIAKLSAKCHAVVQGTGAKVTGGTKTVIKLESPRDWCDYYGVSVKNGVAVLYKALRPDFLNPHNGKIKYTPGTMPEAPDWDGGEQECGRGLHFSPSPAMAREFHSDSTARFVACPVKLSEMAIHPDGDYPQKCKAKRVFKPCWEVNEDGEPVGEKS